MKNKKDRHLDVSSKLIEMGQSLINEGRDNDDFAIGATGTFMVLIGGLLFEEKDIRTFGELCSMYSSKKILEDLERSIPNLSSLIKEKGGDESYDDIIKKINKLRGDLGNDTQA